MTASWVSGCGDKCFDTATSFSCKDNDADFCMSGAQNNPAVAFATAGPH